MEKNIGGGYVYTESDTSASYADEGFSVESLNDVEVSNPENGQALVYDSSSQKWVNDSVGGGSSTLSALTDVDITNPANGQTLVYNTTTEKWENGASGGGGGFTLLHGTYSLVGDVETVTLQITASALYALMQTSCVAFDFEQGNDSTSMFQLTNATQRQDGDIYTYFFASYILGSAWAASRLDGADTVVFSRFNT